jgi:dienelactone hydrolase
MNRLTIVLAVCVFFGLPSTVRAADPFWDVKRLSKAPRAEWGERKGLIQEVLYAGEPWKGKPTRVFAYYAHPEGSGPFPAVVLVHGGGGTAFPAWALHWAERGYAAIAMDLTGHSPKGQLPDGGPDPNDSTFRPFADAEAREMWTYHAVADVILAHSLLVSRPEVDRNRIGLTGISWGGYLTCIVAGVDHRFKAAVPVYGCGFLHENSSWKEPVLDRMAPELRERWVRLFDPSQYLGSVRCPILFLNGTNDVHYRTDSWRGSCDLVHAPKTLSLQIRLPHGHIWTFGIVDAFLDSQLRGGEPLPKVGPTSVAAGVVEATVDSPKRVAKAEIYYTPDTGPWQQREWKTAPARLEGNHIVAHLPRERPLVFYLAVTDERGNIVTTRYAIRER